MVSKSDDDQSLEVTQSQSEGQYLSSEESSSESYSRMLSNQTSDVLDMLDDSSSETQYTDGQQYYSSSQDDSGSVA